MNRNSYLFDDEGAAGRGDYVDKVEIAVADFFDLQSIELVGELGEESRRGLYVVYESRLVQASESR